MSGERLSTHCFRCLSTKEGVHWGYFSRHTPTPTLSKFSNWLCVISHLPAAHHRCPCHSTSMLIIFCLPLGCFLHSTRCMIPGRRGYTWFTFNPCIHILMLLPNKQSSSFIFFFFVTVLACYSTIKVCLELINATAAATTTITIIKMPLLSSTSSPPLAVPLPWLPPPHHHHGQLVVKWHDWWILEHDVSCLEANNDDDKHLLDIQECSTHAMQADILTKGLLNEKFEACRKMNQGWLLWQSFPDVFLFFLIQGCSWEWNDGSGPTYDSCILIDLIGVALPINKEVSFC